MPYKRYGEIFKKLREQKNFSLLIQNNIFKMGFLLQ